MTFDLALPSPSLSHSQGTSSSAELNPGSRKRPAAATPWEQLAEAIACTGELSHIASTGNANDCLRTLHSSSHSSIFTGLQGLQGLDLDGLVKDEVAGSMQCDRSYQRSFSAPTDRSRGRDHSSLELLATKVTLLQAENRKLVENLTKTLKDNKYLSAQVEMLREEMKHGAGAASFCAEVLRQELSPTRGSSLSSAEMLEQVNTLDSLDLSWCLPGTPTASNDVLHESSLLAEELLAKSRGSSFFSKHGYKPFTNLPNQFFYWEWPSNGSTDLCEGSSQAKSPKRAKK